MLKVYHQYSELNISNLLAVYEDTIKQSQDGRFDAEQDFCDYLRNEFFSMNGSYYAVWCQDNCYVCALRMEPYRDGYLLTGLETAPQARRMGYGTALLNAVCQSISPVYSHVHRSNRASLRLHRNCGFIEICDYAMLLDGTVSSQYVTLCFKHEKPTSN